MSLDVIQPRARDVLRVITCVPDQRLHAQLSEAMRDRATVRVVTKFADLAASLRTASERVDIVIVPHQDTVGRDGPDFVREMAGAYAHITLVAYCRADAGQRDAISGFVKAGVHSLIFDFDSSRAVLQSILASARQRRASDRVMVALSRIFDGSLMPVVRIALGRPADIHELNEVASAVGVHRKTLYNRCHKHGLPGPAELLTWIRLCLAAELLGQNGRTVESVADELQFASVTALHNVMKHYTGRSIGTIRAAGGLACVVAALEACLPAKAS